jgi:NDP-sugar pyrophosphorylase family protein
MNPDITALSTYFPHLLEFEHHKLFEGLGAPWEAVGRIGRHLEEAIARARSTLPTVRPEGLSLQQRTLRAEETILFVTALVEVPKALVVEGTEVVLGAGVVLEPGALIKSPAVIGEGSEVRQGAYLRGDVLTGKRCTIGHDTEVKNSIFMNHSEAGHFAYVGDSVLGSYVNLGAGTKLANLQLRRADDKLHERFPPIRMRFGGEEIDTGLPKLGAILGDYCETGCNSVTAPAVLCGAHCWISACKFVKKGYYPPRTIIH